MIVLDTNVVSEILKGQHAAPPVRTWFRSLRETPVTTLITRAELLSGVASLPEGRRRDELGADIQRALMTLGACLPLTEEMADRYAECVARRRLSGRPLAGFDGLIAATCLTVDASLATRNVRDFEGLGLTLINPWEFQ
ncbi:type II toxin-antitoxin system VapC family toxin [Luteococcus sp. H138]|uniref:type II toxin-antitoxin system VapC family toxin n=1 Tax=unclassified Luteococcus TaxID=2639923 RepID=UPI00313BF5A3